MPYRFRDSFSFPWSTVPSGRYDLLSGSGVSVTAGVLRCTASMVLLKSYCLSDYTFIDSYVQAKVAAISANSTSFTMYHRHDGGTGFYAVTVNLVAASYSFKSSGTTLSTAGIAVAAGDTWYSDVVGSGASTTLRLYKNGSLVASQVDASGSYFSGSCGIGVVLGGAGTTDIDDLDIGVAVAGQTPAQNTSTVLYTGKRFAGTLSRVGLYASSYDGGELDNQGNVVDALWNPGGGNADWSGYLSSVVGQYLKYGYRRVVFRGPGGNNTVGCNFADSYTTAASPTPTQCVANILGMRWCDIYRNVTDSGFVNVMANARLLDNFQTAWEPYLALLDEVQFYHSAPPNGVQKTGSGGGTPTAYANSDPAFMEWDQEFLNLGAVSTRAGVSTCYDTLPAMDPGSGSPAANNVIAKAFCDHLLAYRTHRFYGEPHPDKNAGGTNANTSYFFTNPFNIISVSNPTLAIDVARRSIQNPASYYGKPDMGNNESIAWVDGSWTAAQRYEICRYFLASGWTVFVEPGGMTAAQHYAINALGGATPGRSGRGSVRLTRSSR